MLLIKKKNNFIEKKKDSNKFTKNKINNEIKTKFVRLILEDGTQIGVIETTEALNKARYFELDLVEISPNSEPPVCKIMDYGKYKYKQKRKASEIKKKQTVVETKEIKMRPKIDIHDYEVKREKIKNFLIKGNRCKITILFKGREIIHKEIGRELLMKVIKELEEFCNLENNPKFEGKQLFVYLSKKKGIYVKNKK